MRIFDERLFQVKGTACTKVLRQEYSQYVCKTRRLEWSVREVFRNTQVDVGAPHNINSWLLLLQWVPKYSVCPAPDCPVT